MENLDELTLLLLRAPRISFVYKQAKDVQTPGVGAVAVDLNVHVRFSLPPMVFRLFSASSTVCVRRDGTDRVSDGPAPMMSPNLKL